MSVYKRVGISDLELYNEFYDPLMDRRKDLESIYSQIEYIKKINHEQFLNVYKNVMSSIIIGFCVVFILSFIIFMIFKITVRSIKSKGKERNFIVTSLFIFIYAIIFINLDYGSIRLDDFYNPFTLKNVFKVLFNIIIFSGYFNFVCTIFDINIDYDVLICFAINIIAYMVSFEILCITIFGSFIYLIAFTIISKKAKNTDQEIIEELSNHEYTM